MKTGQPLHRADIKGSENRRLPGFLILLVPIWTSAYLTLPYPAPSTARLVVGMWMSLLVLIYLYILIGILWRINQLKKVQPN